MLASMIEIEARLDELKALGLHRRTRLVSGPQGPHVLVDGKPVLLLCSSNYLGLADHPRVREAAADAAMRWGVGAGASRLMSGTITIHRRLEERLAVFTGPAVSNIARLRLAGLRSAIEAAFSAGDEQVEHALDWARGRSPLRRRPGPGRAAAARSGRRRSGR